MRCSFCRYPRLDDLWRSAFICFVSCFRLCPMSQHGQSPQENSAPKLGGVGQAVVEMCEVRETGLIFWSRQRFQVGVELQVRMRRETLPASFQAGVDKNEPWMLMRGFVVQCTQLRRKDGTVAFRVVMLFDSAPTHPDPLKAKRCFMRRTVPSGLVFGLN